MQAWIYILHFHEPLHHASHYSGTTCNLRGRLFAHANGRGARLTQVIRDLDISWTLGGLYSCTQAAARRLERQLKRQNNGPRYCQICTKTPCRIPDATNYPIELARYESADLRVDDWEPNVAVRFTSEDEPTSTMDFVKALMRHDKDALGFIPVGGEAGINRIAKDGMVAIAELNDQLAGYAAFTLSRDAQRLTIHQCCVRDDARHFGCGRKMVDAIRARFPYSALHCKVKEELAANYFWEAIGFTLTQANQHGSSENRINHYYISPILAKE